MGKKVEEKQVDFTIDTEEVQNVNVAQQTVADTPELHTRGRVNVASRNRDTDNLINCL